MSDLAKLPRSVEDERGPLAGVLDEALRLVKLAQSHELTARLLGGTAIQLIGRSVGVELFSREPQDIDLVCPRGTGAAAKAVLARSGYRPDEMFNAVNGHRRLLFFDDAHARQVDVFIGQFAMCHSIPIGDRLGLEAPTLPLAELLMMKLQIVELNAKDQTDILRLLMGVPLAEHDRRAINCRYIADLCAADWGLWRTVTMNLQRTRQALVSLGLPSDAAVTLDGKIAHLEAMLEETPKSRKWRLRAKVGDRVRWYDEPEEVS